MNEIDTLVDGYWRWLRDKTVVRQINGWTEITTPYLDRHNDYIQIYARKGENGFVITDDGYTLLDLEQAGCSLESRKRQEILKTILNGFGVCTRSGAIEVHATAENFAMRKHNLIQAIISVHDMFVLASPTIEAIFFDDVSDWLESIEVRFIPRVKFTGRSGFDHMFDFVIPRSRDASERIIRAINNPNRTTALTFITAWEDTRPSRPDNAMPFAFLNDNEKIVGGNVFDAFRNYNITPIVWSNRDQFRDQLVA